MRVLLDCRMATWTGIGRYTAGLARALAERDDVELVQLCAVGERPPVCGEGARGGWRAAAAGGRPGGTSGGRRAGAERRVAEVMYVSGHPFGPRGAAQVGRAAVRARVDLVHSVHFPTPLPARGPLVVTLHDLTPLLVPGVIPSTAGRAAYRLWNLRAAHVADLILVPSAATAADVERLLPHARGKVVVVPEAADDFAAGPVGPLPARLAAATAVEYLLAVGPVKPHKGLETLLRAFTVLAAARPSLALVVAGVAAPAGGLPAGLPQGLAAALQPGVRTRVVWAGRVDDASLRALYAGAVAFVMPAFHEGFGLPVLEAMALGAPVVCARAASLPEVAGDAAVLFPAGDVSALAAAVARLLDDAALRDRLRAAGRARAAQFTWAAAAAATVDAYREALACHRTRRVGASLMQCGRSAGSQGGEGSRG